MRVAAAPQMVLELDPPSTADRWSRLPETARVQVLALLARLIARGVLVVEDSAGRTEPGDGC
jgi:hypothetical protein